MEFKETPSDNKLSLVKPTNRIKSYIKIKNILIYSYKNPAIIVISNIDVSVS